MKLRLTQFLAILYVSLVMVLLKHFSFLPVIFLAAAVVIDYSTGLKAEIKNLAYLLAALSAVMPLFGIFALYLPFAIFGFLLAKRSFTANYTLGFALSFIPSTIVYLISTYLSIPLNLAAILAIFYLMPIAAIFLLRSRCLGAFEIGNREALFIMAILIFTTVVGLGIVDDKNLFMANGSREFYRVQNSVMGLRSTGYIPAYDPAIASGEPTYLWVPGAHVANISIINYFLIFIHPILFFNAHSFFILFLSTLSLGIFFFSVLNRERTYLNTLAVVSVTLLTGLNFFFLQSLEMVKQYTLYPFAYLLLALILDNPKSFNEYIVLMFLSVLSVMIHPSYGIGVIILGACIFIGVKSYYLKDRNELQNFFRWSLKNKTRLLMAFFIALLLPLFYIYSPFVFGEFFTDVPDREISYETVKHDVTQFWREFYGTELHYLSVAYPDVNRIDDHKFGFFISFFGAASFILLMMLYKSISIKNFRIYAFAYILNLAAMALITAKISVRVGGFYRTAAPFLLILLGASILALFCLTDRKYLKLALIGVVSAGFIHTITYASQNINNIHREQFMSGEISRDEISFVSQLPIDGRIMTYGLFSNVVDYGIIMFTGRYMSRNERIELAIERTIFDKIHDQNSFGEPNKVLTKSGTELANYLMLGGYKYVFLNVCHPIGNYVALNIYPNFSYPLYQNECMVFLEVNQTNYAEKVSLVKNVTPEIYRQKYGYRYVTLSPYYNFPTGNINFRENPDDPKPLSFERADPATVYLYGDFEEGDIVVFKEQYFTRWKAYMDGKEIPAFANNFDMIMLKTLKGGKITLNYVVLPIEKLFGILSLIGALGLGMLMVSLLSNKPAPEPDESKN